MKLKVEVDLPGLTGADFGVSPGAPWTACILAELCYAIDGGQVAADRLTVREIADEDVNPTTGNDAARMLAEDQDAPLSGDAL